MFSTGKLTYITNNIYIKKKKKKKGKITITLTDKKKFLLEKIQYSFLYINLNSVGIASTLSLQNEEYIK